MRDFLLEMFVAPLQTGGWKDSLEDGTYIYSPTRFYFLLVRFYCCVLISEVFLVDSYYLPLYYGFFFIMLWLDVRIALL
jgi:hypothetical protein